MRCPSPVAVRVCAVLPARAVQTSTEVSVSTMRNGDPHRRAIRLAVERQQPRVALDQEVDSRAPRVRPVRRRRP